MMHQSSPTSVTFGATGGSGMSAANKTNKQTKHKIRERMHVQRKMSFGKYVLW